MTTRHCILRQVGHDTLELTCPSLGLIAHGPTMVNVTEDMRRKIERHARYPENTPLPQDQELTVMVLEVNEE